MGGEAVSRGDRRPGLQRQAPTHVATQLAGVVRIEDGGDVRLRPLDREGAAMHKDDDDGGARRNDGLRSSRRTRRTRRGVPPRRNS